MVFHFHQKNIVIGQSLVKNCAIAFYLCSMLTRRFKILYGYLQILSIDIVLGACAGMLFFDRLIGADLRLILYLLLALAVWCIYTFDHLWDARQIKDKASTIRHAFHQNHARTLTVFLVVLGSGGLATAFYFLKIKFILFTGLALGGIILLSFIMLKLFPRRWAFFKEISIATLYVGGIMLAPYFHNDLVIVPQGFWLLGLAYVLLAWFNTLYLGIMDSESDKKDGLYSFARAVGQDRTSRLLFGLMALKLIYILSLYLLLHSRYHLHISIVLIMALIHCISYLQGGNNVNHARRKLDACFMLPFILFLV
jgi:4-hydroxybenzoate polyprenyltransferase